MQLTKFILLCISISLESNILLSTLNLEKLRSFQCSFSRIDINFCGIIQRAFLIFPPVKLQDLQNYQRTLTLWPLIFIYTVKDLFFFHKNGYIILKTLKKIYLRSSFNKSKLWNKRLLFCVSVNQEARNQTTGEGAWKEHLGFCGYQDVFRILYQTYNCCSL